MSSSLSRVQIIAISSVVPLAYAVFASSSIHEVKQEKLIRRESLGSPNSAPRSSGILNHWKSVATGASTVQVASAQTN